MSGYLYPYTPYPTAGNLQTSGQAFLGGFGAGQELESRAQEMDARNQLQKLRQMEEERQRQAFPLRMQQAEQQLKFAAQTQPLALERARLTNQQLQSSIAAAAQQRAAAAEFARLLAGGAPMAAPPSAAPTAPAAPGVPITQSPGLVAPAAPAPAAPQFSPFGEETPGPQSSAAPSWLSAGFGDRRFTGMRLASAGVNDVTGLPTGMTPEMLEPDYQQYPQTGFPTEQEGPSPTAPGALPAAMLPPEQRTGAAAPAAALPTPPALPSPTGRLPLVRPDIIPSPSSPRLMDAAVAELSASPSLQTPDMVQRVAGQYGVDPNALAQRLGVTLPTQAVAPQTTTPEFAPFGETVPGLAGAIPAIDYTPAPTEGPAGLRPQGAETPQQIQERLQRQLTSSSDLTLPGLSVFDPYTAGVEARELDNASARLDLQERQVADMRRQAAILARSGPAGMTQAMQMMQAIRVAEVELLQRRQNLGVSRANLNGRANISEFNNGNFAPLADDIFRSSNGSLRLQPTQDGKFNVLDRDNNVIATRTKDDILTVGRRLYDENYKKAIEENRTRIATRREALFKTTLDAFEQSLKDQSAAGRDISVERAKADFKRQIESTELDMRVTPNGEIIVVHKNDPTKPLRAYRVQEAVDPRTGRRTGRNELVPVAIAPEAVFTQ